MELSNFVNISCQEKIHQDVKLHKYSLCAKELSSPLNFHRKLHQDLKTYKCSVCKFEFTHDNTRKLHEITHHGNWSECSVCKKKFTTSYVRNLHERNVHQGVKPFKCSVCKKQFISATSLKRHEKVHEGLLYVKPYKCSMCSKEFSQYNTCQSHERNIHQVVYLDENKVLQGSEMNEEIQSQDPLDIETKMFVHETEFAELHANNDSEFSGDILTKKK